MVPVAEVAEVYEISFVTREYRVAELEVTVDGGVFVRHVRDEPPYPVLFSG